MNTLKKSPVTSQKELNNFKYVGLNIVQRQMRIYLDQQMLADELKQLDINREGYLKKAL